MKQFKMYVEQQKVLRRLKLKQKIKTDLRQQQETEKQQIAKVNPYVFTLFSQCGLVSCL